MTDYFPCPISGKMCADSACFEQDLCVKSGNKLNRTILRTDPVIEAVRKDLHDRSQLGIKKYGTTLGENKADLKARLQHAYEETLDQANYLKWAIMYLDAE